MNGVNLDSPDLKLVRSSDQAPARASSSPQPKDSDVSVQAGTRATEAREVEQARRVEQDRLEREQLDEAVSQLNDYVQSVQRDLQFEVDNELGRTIVRVVDQETQEVIRQIPDEVALKLAEKLQQDEPLTLFNVKV
ncbi:flagellar protein FlaG [Marinobacter lutaoensis]|jgi:flagellar protein FlaG|uniref:Flagellar biosynthesis protein FlaG n=1 Tax=Marinobacter lutaoensis TaxID=135739 RepID=A0A1V2DWD1_9GAMM|nr:flagellar protein FlaG [Marinobacter lutaoensis]NVD34518.1 flagellar protein FlaG [Marinobacter lutaoensis]ONF45084.1 flagellar biosynthesis protein FlaG [Marinobacter lutaoensis]